MTVSLEEYRRRRADQAAEQKQLESISERMRNARENGRIDVFRFEEVGGGVLLGLGGMGICPEGVSFDQGVAVDLVVRVLGALDMEHQNRLAEEVMRALRTALESAGRSNTPMKGNDDS